MEGYEVVEGYPPTKLEGYNTGLIDSHVHMHLSTLEGDTTATLRLTLLRSKVTKATHTLL